MSEKKYRSRDIWKDIINKLEFTDFQNLVYDLLNAQGFIDIKQRGGGSDGGRDLEAYYEYRRPTGDKYRAKCWIQCKKQAYGVSYKQISEDIFRAATQKVDDYYILSNYDTTPDCKDEIERVSATISCKIIDRTGLRFQDMLFNYPDICRYYFPDEEVPPIADVKNPEDVIKLSNEVGKQFGIELKFKVDKKVDLNNPTIVADILKDALLKINNIDINLQALIYQKVSMFFFGLEKSEDALMFLNKSLDITPKNVEALLSKGFILEKIDDVEESNKCYDDLLSIEPTNKFALNNKSHNYIRMGLYNDALQMADKALEIDSDFINAIGNKANALKGLKKVTEAIDFLKAKKELVDKSVLLKTTLVDLYIEQVDLKEAYRLNGEILSQEPNNVAALNSKGVIYEKNSKYQHTEKYLNLAYEIFEKVIEKDGKFPIGWSNKAVTLLNSNQVDDAEKIIDMAYTLFPKYPEVLNKKGVILLVKKKPKEAQKYFDRALRLRYRDEFYLNKGKSLLDQNHYKDALKVADDLIKRDKEYSEAWLLKGNALRGLHQLSRASKCFENTEKFKIKPVSLLEDN